MREVFGKFIFAAVMLTALTPIHWGFVVIGAGLVLFGHHWWIWLIGGILVLVGLIARKIGKEFKI